MNNSSKWGGGVGISGIIKGEAYRFDACRFWNNKAATNGGALSIYSHGNVDLANCILAGNSAANGGAISGHSSARLSIINCTSAENGAVSGQFIFLHALYPAVLGPTTIANSIIVENGSAIRTEDIGVSLTYSLLSGGRGSIIDPNNKVAWGVGNISVDPCFTDPGHWDSNATPEDAKDNFYIVGDYHLKSQGGRWNPNSQIWVIDDVTSPCIDAGDPDSAIGYEPFPNGGRINMGVYGGTREASKSYFAKPPCQTIVSGDVNGDCRVDFVDLQIMALHWLEKR
jgi:hypothetical protein